MTVTNDDNSIDAIRRRFSDVIVAANPEPAARHWRVRGYERGLRLADEIEARIGSLAGKRVLDVGTSYGGGIVAMYARGATCVGADKFDRDYRRMKEQVAPGDDRLKFTVFDCTTAWPLETDGFDVVVSLGVLEFLDDLEGFFAEMARVLRPGGIAMIYTGTVLRMARRDPLYKLPLIGLFPTPVRRWVAGKLLGRPYWIPVASHTFYSAADIKRYVTKHGLDALPMKYAGSPLMARVGRWPFGKTWQRLIRHLAFDYVFVVSRGRTPT